MSAVSEPAVIVLAAVTIMVPPKPMLEAEALTLASVTAPLSASIIICPPMLFNPDARASRLPDTDTPSVPEAFSNMPPAEPLWDEAPILPSTSIAP